MIYSAIDRPSVNFGLQNGPYFVSLACGWYVGTKNEKKRLYGPENGLCHILAQKSPDQLRSGLLVASGGPCYGRAVTQKIEQRENGEAKERQGMRTDITQKIEESKTGEAKERQGMRTDISQKIDESKTGKAAGHAAAAVGTTLARLILGTLTFRTFAASDWDIGASIEAPIVNRLSLLVRFATFAARYGGSKSGYHD